MSGRSAPSAWLILITLATITYRSAGQPLELIACSQPDSFTVQITENENVVVYGTELLIRYNPRAGIYALPGTDAVNVVFNESTIEFKGYMSHEYPATLPWGSPERLSWTSSGIILGTGMLQELSKEDYALQECRSFLPKNINSSVNLPFAVEDEIANHARYCIEEYLCKGPIQTEELRSINKYHRSKLDVSASYATASDDIPQQNCTNIDILNTNELIDLVVNTAVKYVRKHNKSIIIFPDVDEVYKLGPFGMKCHFQALNGSFRDLSTLKRTENTYVSGMGRTHTINVGLGLSIARFHFDYYKIKYGFLALNGEITGTIDGLALSITAVIDYDKDCPLRLKHFKVTRFGDIKVKMTGLGAINSVTSKILSWLTNMWRKNIANLIEVNVKQNIEVQLNEKVCTSSFIEAIAG
ncbi:PREDICTED: uncharacterized protein LOC106750817 [Dinoponera quadriceps]|uniref:Uncharacterized protein LOC106750817 n=1 Tax=Dinoponera quadriceps TaxID=609295 RepID=A0A6P3YA62_DINQU|nr:PREDICTED: uncharacterized protein LOC106750817 [Dinoponera quadriceps]